MKLRTIEAQGISKVYYNRKFIWERNAKDPHLWQLKDGSGKWFNDQHVCDWIKRVITPVEAKVWTHLESLNIIHKIKPPKEPPLNPCIEGSCILKVDWLKVFDCHDTGDVCDVTMPHDGRITTIPQLSEITGKRVSTHCTFGDMIHLQVGDRIFSEKTLQDAIDAAVTWHAENGPRIEVPKSLPIVITIDYGKGPIDFKLRPGDKVIVKNELELFDHHTESYVTIILKE